MDTVFGIFVTTGVVIIGTGAVASVGVMAYAAGSATVNSLAPIFVALSRDIPYVIYHPTFWGTVVEATEYLGA
jgi:hypothetical protein